MHYINKDFLLDGRTAKHLYHDYASMMPIIDYHCHLDPEEIYSNKRFTDLSEVWLSGDHYKWRLMRANGGCEKLITGEANGWDKFTAFAEVLPRAVGSPIYHWTHLELRRYFGCDEVLCPDTAEEIWEFCNQKLRNFDELSVHGILKRSHVEALVTTDDPADDLQWHIKIAGDFYISTKVLPGWRMGAVLNIESPDFSEYINKLGVAADTSIESYSDLKATLTERMKFFNYHGCLSGDHGIAKLVYAPASDGQLQKIFAKALGGDAVSEVEADQYRFGLLSYCAKEYARLGWVMQFRLGTLRNVNTAMLKKIGPDTGFDCSAFTGGMFGLAKFLDCLELEGLLPKTLLFSIDSMDNMALATLAACFTETDVRGKVQQGSAWWFNDTYSGMEQQIICFAEQGVLGNFIGMLTDSRSFLSYTRHEYFRRLLCNVIGNWVDTGRYPDNQKYLGSLIQDICYNNVKEYFGF
ncbi:MAG: glucuronate isomerase [Oscillospiraceae bacterium]|nr:glucuronate isomerase [Oscillospiraceae bacterium]